MKKISEKDLTDYLSFLWAKVSVAEIESTSVPEAPNRRPATRK